MAIEVRLPTWEQCSAKEHDPEITALEEFIANNEPESPNDAEWRRMLACVLAETIEEDAGDPVFLDAVSDLTEEIEINPRECGRLVYWAINRYGGIKPALEMAEAVAAWMLASNETWRESGETTASLVPHFHGIRAESRTRAARRRLS